MLVATEQRQKKKKKKKNHQADNSLLVGTKCRIWYFVIIEQKDIVYDARCPY